jgi:hypothetical protein
MLIFLLNDMQRRKPLGYEDEHRNIFDPADDTEGSSIIIQNGENDHSDNKNEILVSDHQGGAKCLCLWKDCAQKARFDSLFCSDACGVAALESDLLRSFHYSSDMHPSSLRH